MVIHLIQIQFFIGRNSSPIGGDSEDKQLGGNGLLVDIGGGGKELVSS